MLLNIAESFKLNLEEEKKNLSLYVHIWDIGLMAANFFSQTIFPISHIWDTNFFSFRFTVFSVPVEKC